MRKGQFIRLFVTQDNSSTGAPDSVIAAAKSLSLHISVSVENITTKDTDGYWIENQPTGITYDISTSALILNDDPDSGKSLDDMESIMDGGNDVPWEIANVSGAHQQTKGSVICSGRASFTQLTINAQNRQTASYDCQMQGYGELVVGSGGSVADSF